MRSSRDRLEDVFSRLAARQRDERVFTKLYHEAARAAADAADARRKAGVGLGPLDGRIISIKDLFDVAGEPTIAGAAMRATAPVAQSDAVAVARLRRAGAVILGKTAMTEFAFTAIGDNPHFGMPGNAADASRIPGGSSSGAGVSVAEGTSDISIGSDTGGSVRIPAALNGVVGFKPTARRVPLAGAFPLSFSLDSIGPIARSVADCVAADAVMAGQEWWVLPSPIPLAGLRVALPRGQLFEHMQAGVSEAFERCIDRLAQAGLHVFDLAIDDLLSEMRAATRRASIAALEGAAVHADWLAQSVAAVDPHVGEPLARAALVPASVYIRTMRRRTELVAAMDERLAGVDALALPTVPITAPTIAGLADDAALRNRTEGLLLRNTQLANQFDLCAVSLPMPDTGMPAGLMLVGRHGQDNRLLGMAMQMETLLAG